MNNTLLDTSLTTSANRPVAPWRRWLRAFYAFDIATNTLFTSAIWVIYLASHGFSPLMIGLFETIFHIAKFVAEVPTGIFADLVGRRKSLILCCITNAISSFLFLVPSVPLITLSFVLSGFSYAFRGGSQEAILWTIAGHAEPTNQAGRYSKLVSRMFLLGLVGEIVGTASGGFLGNILVILPFLCAGIATLLGIIPLLFIPEQRGIAEHEERPHPLVHFGRGLRAVWQKPTLLNWLLIDALAESCWQTIYFYYQLYLHGLGLSLSLIGLTIALSTLTNFLFTAIAPYIMRVLPSRWLVPTFVLVEIAGLFCMSLPWPAVDLFGYLILFQASVAVLAPATSTYINEHCPEAQRATIFSLQTGLFSAAMIVLFPLFGLGIMQVAYSTVYLWTLLALALGSIVVFGGTLLLTHLRKAK
ncbi:MAG TPA: MFS transporter [Ktedonobacteraceae bacterium]|jgi:MFS family permease|nr:MFS transporter [Ktedonobacteraceae bacterium]